MFYLLSRPVVFMSFLYLSASHKLGVKIGDLVLGGFPFVLKKRSFKSSPRGF